MVQFEKWSGNGAHASYAETMAFVSWRSSAQADEVVTKNDRCALHGMCSVSGRSIFSIVEEHSHDEGRRRSFKHIEAAEIVAYW